MNRAAETGFTLLEVLVALAIAVWFFTRPQPEVTTPPAKLGEPLRFSYEGLSVESADLRVGPASVRGAIHSGYLSWIVIANCAEPEGCAGEFRVEIEYDTGSEVRKISVDTRCDVPFDGELRLQGIQDPPVPVNRIERLKLEVIERGRLGGPVPDETEF